MREVAGLSPRDLGPDVLEATERVVLRGLVAGWPMVAAARESADAADAYLLRFYRDATVTAMLGAPVIEGRFFYNDDLSGYNFAPVRMRIDKVLGELARYRDGDKAQGIYVGSTTIDTALPGLHCRRPAPFYLVSATAAGKFVCRAARLHARRAGHQPVDFLNPDLERFPRFAQAMEHALTADLGAGDALFIPSMWWQHIQALDAFNVPDQ